MLSSEHGTQQAIILFIYCCESPHLLASIKHLSFGGDPGTILERTKEREIKAVEDQ